METRRPLPDNDQALAAIARIGLDEWTPHAAVIRAFFKPKDGLLHHKKCNKELDKQDKIGRKRSEIAEKGAAARWGKNNGIDASSIHEAKSEDAPSISIACLPDATGQDRTLQNKESKKEAPAATAAPEPVYIPLHMVRAINGDWRTILYQQGLDWLSRHEGKRPNELRSLIGLWLKRSGDDAKAVFDLLAECDLRKIAAPVDWVSKALKPKSQSRFEPSPDIVPSSYLAAPASWGDG